MQYASYFRLPLARGIELFGVDRQLRTIDSRQQAFLKSKPGVVLVVLLPDPACAWGDERPHGQTSLRALGIDPERDPTLIVSGDIHHYERSHQGASIHVNAGGGGALLHGARMSEQGASYAREVEFPGALASWSMYRRLPWHLGWGGAGWVITVLFAVVDRLAVGAYFLDGLRTSAFIAALMSVAVAIGTAMLIARRRRIGSILALSSVFGAA